MRDLAWYWWIVFAALTCCIILLSAMTFTTTEISKTEYDTVIKNTTSIDTTRYIPELKEIVESPEHEEIIEAEPVKVAQDTVVLQSPEPDPPITPVDTIVME